MTRLFLVAGEPSGDLLGGALLAGLRELRGDVLEVAGVGGPAMAAEGLESLFPMHELSLMGIAEVLPKAPLLLRRLRQTADAVIAAQPDALVTIDSPDFGLRVAHRVRRRLPHLRTIHYVAPSVWAWRPGRAVKMARNIDHVLALLPFEPLYMTAAGMTCDFVGHPIATQVQATETDRIEVRRSLGILPEQPLLCLLPGSRSGEVRRLAPVFAEVARRLMEAEPRLAVVAPAGGNVVELLHELLPAGADGWPKIVDPRPLASKEAESRKRALFGTANVSVAASGTVSLEIAAAGAPMVVAYDSNPLTAWLVKRLVRIETATLVNLITETRAVPEFLFENCTPDLIASAALELLRDPGLAAKQIEAGNRAMELLGRGGEPSGLRAARSVLSVIGR